MKIVTLDVPAMFGDHHVVEVRRLLLEMPGVVDMHASSSFQKVEVQYDESRLALEMIKTRLAEAGYAGDLPVPVEPGAAANGSANGRRPFFRHTAAYAQTGPAVSFAQTVPYTGRPVWPCPGMGPLNTAEETTNG